jgi:hypothetical protein
MEVQALLVFSETYLIGSVPAQREGVTVVPGADAGLVPGATAAGPGRVRC